MVHSLEKVWSVHHPRIANFMTHRKTFRSGFGFSSRCGSHCHYFRHGCRLRTKNRQPQSRNIFTLSTLFSATKVYKKKLSSERDAECGIRPQLFSCLSLVIDNKSLEVPASTITVAEEKLQLELDSENGTCIR